MTRILSGIASALVTTILPGLSTVPAQAGTQTTTYPVTFVANATCSATTTGSMAFGSLAASLSVAATNATGTISVTCSNGGTYTIIADTGLYVSSSQRQMSKNAATGPFLKYNIYSDSGRSVAYPTAIASATVLTGTGTASTYTIYGAIPAQTATASGAYTDTLTFTITY